MRLPLLFALAAAVVRAIDQAPLVQDTTTPTPTPTPPPPPYRDDLLALHRALIEHSSTSGHETDVGVWLRAYLQDRGYTTALLPVPREGADAGRANVVAWWGGDDTDAGSGSSLPPIPIRPLLLTSHIDVVPPHIPYAIDNATGPAARTTLVAGRGAVDAKASVAAQITAVEALRAAGRAPDDVLLLFVVGEEDSGDGMRAFSEYMHAHSDSWFKAAIFGEPTENRLACGHKGILNCAFAATGKAGHSGYPELGRSATALLVHALAAVLDADLGASPVFGPTTVNVGTVRGGVAANVIAAEAHAGVAVRVAVGPQRGGEAVVRRRMEVVVAEVAARMGAPADALTVDCPVGYGVVECQCQVPGFPTITVNYGTDVPNLAGNHTPFLYGPGAIRVAHGAQEAITVGALEDAVEAYKRLIGYALGE